MRIDLRVAGGLILLSVALAGVVRVHRETVLRERALAAWLSLLTFLHGQIACFNTPLDEILTRADPELLDAAFLRRDGVSLPFAAQCAQAAREIGGDFGKLLGELAGEIGTLDRPEQLSRLDYYSRSLEELRAVESEKGRTRDRLNATLRLCGAAGIILLLW